MRTIIAGSRGIIDPNCVDFAVANCGWYPTVVLSGTASGVDTLGERWAEQSGVPVERYPANWILHGKRAGPIRNSFMASKAEALIAIWDSQSRGTQHMIEEARQRGLRVFIKMEVLK